MISRRHFLAASGAGVLSSGVALASSGWQDRLFSNAAQRVVLSESFVAPEWAAAFEAAAASSANAADREFWRTFVAQGSLSASSAPGEQTLLSLPAPGLEPFAPKQARELAMVSNDRLAQLVADSKGRVAGLAAVSAFDARAAKEAERAVTRLGLAGVSLGANRGMRLSHRELWPLYEFAQATRTPIYLPAGYMPGVGDAPYRAMGREGVIAGAAHDSASHASQLIFGGVLDAFPKASFVLARLGDAAPHWYGDLVAARAGFDSTDARAPQREISDYFRSNLFLTTADMRSPAAVLFCSATLGKGRVLRSCENAQLSTADAATADLTRVSLDALRRVTWA